MAELLKVQENKEKIENSVDSKKTVDVEDFLKDLETAKKEKWSDETTIATWANIINKFVWKEVFNKGKDYQTYKEKVVEVFNSKGEIVLNNIKDNVNTQINNVNRNDPKDNMVINVNAALQAFTTDIAEYSGKGETLSAEIAIIEEIKKLITDKQTAVKKEESNKLDADGMFKTEPTPELAKQLFDNSDPEIYNAMIAQIVGESEKPIEIKPAVWENPSEEALKIWHLYKRIKTYMESVNIDMKDISDIKVGKPSESFWWRYEKTDIQRVIQYINPTKKNKDDEVVPQYIIQGSHEHLQEELAKANENTELAPNKIIALDKKTRAERLNAFDGIGNYALFNKYLEIKWAEYVKANLTGILQAINVYTPSKRSIDEMDNQLNVFKNGYATTITDYVVAHSGELLESYTNQITESNLNIFGVDQTTRSANFNKLVKQRNDTGLRQRLPKAKQDELIRIKTKIENFDLPKTKEEAIKKWLDNIIDTFGPMLFNILKFFGIGKATLCKRFSGMEAKINGIFSKEYGLSSEQISAIDTISKKFDDKEDLSLDTAQKIQKKFEKQKNTYIGLFLAKENYENLSVEKIKAWLKAKGGSTTIDNIITIKKDKKTGKEYIDAITNEETFKGILWYLFDTEETRTEIHNANKEIQRPNKDNKTITEHNKSREDAARYIIKTDRDIARYLTASWFSTKDLDYVMTENSLHNGSEIQEGDETDKKTLTFIDKEKYFTDGKLNAEWHKKTINEVIDISKSPEKLQIIRADWEIVNIEQKKIGDILTYVEVGKSTKVAIKTWDQIQEMPKQKTPEELALEAFTNNRNKISGDDGIKKTVNEKYDTGLDISNIGKIETTATGELKNYQENILSPLKEVMTNEKQYKLLTDKFVSGTNKTDYEALFTNPLHIANILSIMNTENTTPDTNKEAITNLRAGGTFTVEADGKGLITITSQDKWTITIKQKETNGKITLDALRVPKTAPA